METEPGVNRSDSTADAPSGASGGSGSSTGATGSLQPDWNAAAVPAEQGEVTRLLLQLADGNESAAEALFPLLYDELRRIAHRQLARERPGHTLSTTALVHEAYLRLVDQSRARMVSRVQFLGVAAHAMRRVLVDHARRLRAYKRGGGAERVELDVAEMPMEERSEALLALDEALHRLEQLEPRLVRLVECRFFGGMTEEETAEVLGISDRTVRRDWVKAKGWLYTQLSGDSG